MDLSLSQSTAKALSILNSRSLDYKSKAGENVAPSRPLIVCWDCLAGLGMSWMAAEGIGMGQETSEEGLDDTPLEGQECKPIRGVHSLFRTVSILYEYFPLAKLADNPC